MRAIAVGVFAPACAWAQDAPRFPGFGVCARGGRGGKALFAGDLLAIAGQTAADGICLRNSTLPTNDVVVRHLRVCPATWRASRETLSR